MHAKITKLSPGEQDHGDLLQCSMSSNYHSLRYSVDSVITGALLM